MVIAMPIVRPGTTTVNKDIHVYPKNVTQRDDKKEFVNEKDYTVTINGETFNSAQIGDKFNYKIKVNMPDISNLESFKVIDEPGLGMDMAEPNNLTLPGLTINVDYTVDYDATASGRGFAITFNNTEAVRKLAGKVLPITYTMVLTANAPIDTPINNNAHIEVNGETTTEFTPPNPVYTHGKQFKKVNAKTGEELSGAEFKVKKGSLFAKFTSDQVDGKTVYTLNGWDATGTVVTSGTDGIIRIKGMKVGDYNLIETKAPTGYILESSDIAFTIVKDQYGNAAHIQTVNNLRQGLLPSTGGTGIYAFLIIGSMMMAGAYFWFKRSKEHAEV